MGSIMRQCATPLSLVSFLAVSITGLLLLFGVRSHGLGAVHEWVGVVFILALVLHLARNWRGMLAMFAVRRNQIIIAATGVVAALFIMAALPLGAGGGGHGHGGGPWRVIARVSEAPIGKMAPALGITGEEAVARLRRRGVAVDGPHQSLREIAVKQDQELPRLMNIVLSE